MLRRAADDAARILADRAATQISLDDPLGIAALLEALHEAGAGDAARTLLDRDPAAQVSLEHSLGVGVLLGALREAGAGDAARTLADRVAAQVSLDEPWNVAALLEVLREAGAGDAARTLADRPLKRACSISSSRRILTRLPITCSGASQTEPHRNLGDGKNRAS